MNTAASRHALPDAVPRSDAVFSVVRAALLGAALAANDAHVFAAALDDRLHEPDRAEHAPHLGEIPADLPNGALGAMLSGSGPTVIALAEREAAARVVAELAGRYPANAVMALEVSSVGAGRF